MVKSGKEKNQCANATRFDDMQSKVGGVDPFDLFVATYRARIRSKKWCWPFFAWSFNAAITNDWLLYKKIQGKNIPMLAFMREFVATTLASFRKKSCLACNVVSKSWKTYVQITLTMW